MLPHIVRKARATDVLAISTLILAGSAEATGIEGTPAELDAWRQANASLSLIGARVRDSATIILVAEGVGGSERIGLLGTAYGVMTSASSAYLGGLYVNVRNQGIGKRLLKSLIQEYDKDGFEKLELTVAQNNPVMKHLATSLGFTKHTERHDDRYYPKGVFEEWVRAKAVSGV